MIVDILIFIVFISVLIFFHELGHFLFARYFGVRVETFSIGFGPKILKKKHGDTEYAISAIPFGGYVKMYGDNILEKEDIPQEERDQSYVFKSKWARFWIVFGGPLANFILAYVIFFGLLVSGEKVPEPKLGLIDSKSVLFERGLRTGDVLTQVNQKKVFGFTELVQEAPDKVSDLAVLRDGQEVMINGLNMTTKDFMEVIMTLPPPYRRPILFDKDLNKWAISQNKGSYNSEQALEELLSSTKSEFYLYKLNDNTIDPSTELALEFTEGPVKDRVTNLILSGFYPSDLLVKNVISDRPAKLAGMQNDDLILGLNEVQITSFEQLRNLLQKTEVGNKIQMSVLRKGERQDLSILPSFETRKDKTVVSIGVESGLLFIPPKLIESAAKGIFESTYLAIGKTYDATLGVLNGFIKLITKEVSLKNVGGPLSIAKVASDSFEISLSYFFKIMALISINLAVINLFPIPVLDGGHIVFIIIELINGGPLSKRKTEIALQFGLSVLLLLFVAAIFNDISRFIQ